jgi:hypothetical protein
MSEQETTITGDELTLISGAKVALFKNVEPGAHGVTFTAPDGEQTRLKLSTEALDALASLWSPVHRIFWRVVLEADRAA